jgi:hypothetical protein
LLVLFLISNAAKQTVSRLIIEISDSSTIV